MIKLLNVSSTIEQLVEVDGLQYVRIIRVSGNKLTLIWKRNFDFNKDISDKIKSDEELEVLYHLNTMLKITESNESEILDK